jgi:hypothetical protein
MPAKTTTESQRRALFVRNAIATIDIEYPNAEDNRCREGMISLIIEELKADTLELTHITRLYESACKADAKHSGITELRTAIRYNLGKQFDTKGARKRAKTSQSTPA